MSYFDDHVGDGTPDISALFANDDSPALTKSEGTTVNARNMTLKEQEKKLDELQKENFNLKLRISYLEDGINRMTPENMRQAVHENIELKIRVDRLTSELDDALKRLTQFEGHDCRATTQDLERLQNNYAAKFDSQQKHIDDLCVQLTERRQEADQLRSQAQTFDEQKVALSSHNDLLQAEVEALKAELQFVRKDAQTYKSELLDAQTLLVRSSPTKSPTRSRSPAGDTEADADRRLRKKLKREIEEETEQRYADKMRKVHAQITAQNLIISSRDQEIERLNTNVATLTRELSDQEREIEMYRNTGGLPDNVVLGMRKDDQHMEALRIQIAELNRQLTDKTSEANILKNELASKMQGHDGAVYRLMQQWSAETDELKAKLRTAESEQKRLAKALLAAQQQAKNQQHLSQSAVAEMKTQVNDAEELSVAKDRQVGNLERRIAQLEAELAQKKRDMDAYRREISERVYQEEDLKKEHKHLRGQINSFSKNATSTLSDMELLRDQLDAQARKVDDLQAQLRQEIQRRCEIEEREMKRVKELDEMWRAEVQKRVTLEHQLQDREKEIEHATDNAKRELKEVQESQQVEFDIERQQERSQARQELLLLQKATKEQLHKLRKLVDLRTSELEKARTQLDRWQSDATTHHDKLKHIVEQRHDDVSKQRLQVDILEQEVATKELVLKDKERRIEALEKENRLLQKQAASSEDRLGSSHFRASSISPKRAENADNATAQSAMSKALRYQVDERESLLMRMIEAIVSVLSGKDKQKALASIPAIKEGFSRFSVFVGARLHALGTLHRYFEERVKFIEEHWAREFQLLVGRVEKRIAKLDKFEQVVQTAVVTVNGWKEKLQLKQNEAASLKESNSELAERLKALQLHNASTAVSAGGGKHGSELYGRLREAESRAAEAEQRLHDYENMLTDRLNNSIDGAEDLWRTRLQERERELDRVQEQARRERINARDKVNELVDTVRALEKKLLIAEGKIHELQEVAAIQKATIENKLLTSEMKRESINSAFSESRPGSSAEVKYERERHHREELERELQRLRHDLDSLHSLQRSNSRKVMRALSRLENHQSKDAVILEVVDTLREHDPLSATSSTRRRSQDMPSPASALSSATSYLRNSRGPTSASADPVTTAAAAAAAATIMRASTSSATGLSSDRRRNSKTITVSATSDHRRRPSSMASSTGTTAPRKFYVIGADESDVDYQ
ncbi:hypothetical protein RI367_001950 [Sorochytrium milnesiophthora]